MILSKPLWIVNYHRLLDERFRRLLIFGRLPLLLTFLWKFNPFLSILYAKAWQAEAANLLRANII